MESPPHGPEPCASANSAISALATRFQTSGVMVLLFLAVVKLYLIRGGNKVNDNKAEIPRPPLSACIFFRKLEFKFPKCPRSRGSHWRFLVVISVIQNFTAKTQLFAERQCRVADVFICPRVNLFGNFAFGKKLALQRTYEYTAAFEIIV